MKKTYINPAMEIVEVKVQNLLAGSVTVNMMDTPGTTPTSATTLGRGDDFDWEDEE